MMFRLFDVLFPPREDERILHGMSLAAFSTLSTYLPIPATRPSTAALLPFHEKTVRAAVHEAKYHGTKHARMLLASVLEKYLFDTFDAEQEIIIIPIPLGAARLKERGFNQVEEVARCATTAPNVHLDSTLLKRVRETTSQVSLPRNEREENIRGAFIAAYPLDPTKTYLLLDDVLTTGATIQAGIDALRAGGAIHIVPIALAH